MADKAGKKPTKPARKAPAAKPVGDPILSAKDVRSSLAQKAATMAPGDVDELIAREEEIKARFAGETSPHPLLVRQAKMALQLLNDHVSGIAPQIPYFTISLLGVALFYFLDKEDAIPDWIPNVGTTDDALVLEIAFEMGAAGIVRYCDFKGFRAEDVLPAQNTRR